MYQIIYRIITRNWWLSCVCSLFVIEYRRYSRARVCSCCYLELAAGNTAGNTDMSLRC